MSFGVQGVEFRVQVFMSFAVQGVEWVLLFGSGIRSARLLTNSPRRESLTTV